MNDDDNFPIYPLIVTQAEGGSFDPASFVEGCKFGELSLQVRIALAAQLPLPSMYVSPELVPQVDLMAMHYGLKMIATPWDQRPDEHVLVEFSRDESEEE